MKHRDSLSCFALVCFVLCLFDDIVFQGLNQTHAGLDTGVPNADGLVILFPFFSHFIDSLKETGSLDPWNPYIWGGTPAIGNPNIPFNLLLYALFHLGKRGFIVAMNWHLVGEFCLATTGMYLLARKLSFQWTMCLTAAILVVCSSSAAWLTNTYCIFFHWAVIPWVLLLLLTQEKRSLVLTSIYLSIIFYFQITYGQAQMTIYSLVFFLLSVLWIFRERLPLKKSLATLLAGYVIAGCLALHSLLPQLEFLLIASNRQPERWMTTAANYRVPVHYLLNLFVPRVFWDPMAWWPTWSDGWSPWESFNVYIGLFFVLMAFYGFREFWQSKVNSPRPTFVRRLKWLVLAIVFLDCTVWGGAALVALNLGKDVPYSRFTHFLLYPLILAASAEIQLVFATSRELTKFVGFLGAALLAVALLSRNFSAFVTSLFAQAGRISESHAKIPALAAQFLSLHRDDLSRVFLGSMSLLLALMAILTLAIVLFKKPLMRKMCFSLAVLLGVADLVSFFRDHRQRGHEPYPYLETLHKQNPLLEALRARSSEFNTYTFSTYTKTMETDTGLAPNQNGIWRVPSVNGYSSFTLQNDEFAPKFYRGNWGYPFSEIAVKLNSIKYILLGPRTAELPYQNRLKPIARHGDYTLTEYADALPRFYFPEKIVWGVAPTELKEKLKEVGADPLTRSYTSRAGTFYELPKECQPSVRAVGGTASERILSIENNCGRSVFLAFPRMRHPWWKVDIDDKSVPLVLVNLEHQLVEIQTGTHRLGLRCVPKSWYLGIALSFLTAVILVGTLLYEHGVSRLRFLKLSFIDGQKVPT